jgi:heme oxygenase (mycobilin-producing)
MSIVRINALQVPEAAREGFEARFANRAGMVESAEGFEHFELLRPVEGSDRYLVYTRWRSEADFEAWTKSMAFEQGHAAAGVGQRPHGEGPAAARGELWSFEVLQAAGPKG